MKDYKHHIRAFGKDIYQYLPKDRSYPDDLHLRSVIIEVMDLLPIEFIWRGYMAGSLWKNFYSKKERNPYGLNLPENLTLMSRFEEPIFTPTDKSETDDPLNSRSIEAKYPLATNTSLQIYKLGRQYANERGIEIIDFKSEMAGDVLVDEWLTGDCCRFVKLEDIKEGANPPWMDKEIFRQYAESHWNEKQKTPIVFPPDIIKNGSKKYQELFEMLTGETLQQFQKTYLDT